MELFLNLQAKFKNLIWQMIIVLLFFYFSFYTINGDRGLTRYMYLNREIAYAHKIADQYHTERLKLENKVHLLSSDSLDLDLLDERAKVILNMVKDDEFIILDENNG